MTEYQDFETNEDIRLALVKHLRKAQEEFMEVNNLEGAYFSVNYTVFTLANDFVTPLHVLEDKEFIREEKEQ